MQLRAKVFRSGLTWLGLLTPLLFYGMATLRRPDRIEISKQQLFQGITYSRRIKTQPRPLVIHLFEIDLTAPGLRPLVTPSFKKDADLSASKHSNREALAQRTSDFLQEHRLQLAINANFFFPFREETLWNYEPKQGTPIKLGGLAISDGQVISLPQKDRSALCFLPQRAEIKGNGRCPEGTEQAVAGNTRILKQGQPTKAFRAVINGPKPDQPYPVNIAAVDASGTRLWLILGDGKQPLYSEGMMLAEAVDLVQSLGAIAALRLDGGGSTTAAMAAGTVKKSTEASHKRILSPNPQRRHPRESAWSRTACRQPSGLFCCTTVALMSRGNTPMPPSVKRFRVN